MPGAGQDDSQPLAAGLSPQQLVTPMAPVVNPDSLKVLLNAYHNGIITAGDINDRIGAEAMANKRAHIEQLQEYVSPQAIQARMQQIQAGGAQAGLQATQAGAATGLVQPAADLQRTQLAQQQAATVYGPGGIDTFQKMAPWYGESVSDYQLPNGQGTDFNGMAARGNEMLGQMTIADNWIKQLTPVKDVEKQDPAGNKYIQKQNQWGVNVTPPDPESGFPGSPAYWAYVKQLQPVLPKYHPARGQFLMQPTGGDGDAMPGHPATSSSSGLSDPAPSGPMDGSGNLITPNTQSTALPVVQPPPAAPPQISPSAAGASSSLGIPMSPGTTTAAAKNALEELPDVKAFSTSKPVYIGFADAAKGALEKPTAVSDLGLAESYSKLFDPASSLREFKFDALKESIPWPQKLKDAWPLIMKTHVFPSDVRKDVVDSGLKVIEAREKALQPRFAYAEAQHPGLLDSDQKAIMAGVPFRTRMGVPETGAPQASPARGTRTANLPGIGAVNVGY